MDMGFSAAAWPLVLLDFRDFSLYHYLRASACVCTKFKLELKVPSALMRLIMVCNVAHSSHLLASLHMIMNPKLCPHPFLHKYSHSNIATAHCKLPFTKPSHHMEYVILLQTAADMDIFPVQSHMPRKHVFLQDAYPRIHLELIPRHHDFLDKTSNLAMSLCFCYVSENLLQLTGCRPCCFVLSLITSLMVFLSIEHFGCPCYVRIDEKCL